MNIPEFTQSLAPNLKQNAGNHETCATKLDSGRTVIPSHPRSIIKGIKGLSGEESCFCAFQMPKNGFIEWSIEGGLSAAVRSDDQQKIEQASSHVSASRYLESTPYNSQVGQTYNFNSSSKISVLVLPGLTPKKKYIIR